MVKLNTFKHIILLPVYNDWRSLNRLLTIINSGIKNNSVFKTEILIINDGSKKKINVQKKKIIKIKKDKSYIS